jgi:phthiocerol/phenolphthiocerol synthesis type-I polyketide synthase E
MTADQDEFKVAIIGLSGRFPGAADTDTFWHNLVNGNETISVFTRPALAEAGVSPVELDHPDYVAARGILDNVEMFDAGLFGYSAREAETIDPQHRIFLECAWEALESAGYDTQRYPGSVGVYAGTGAGLYLLNLLSDPRVLASVGPYQLLLANDKDHLTMRVAHRLDLRGPAITVQTACSTSLVATHLAYQALLAHECDMALAGGVTIALPQVAGYQYEPGSIFSPAGICRPFDGRADGTVPGNGAGVVLLKRLREARADGDTIYAVIAGSAVNNDGARKSAYTAPSVRGQVAVVTEALAAADADPASISYVEAHGTGTHLGDPIEIAALKEAFASAPRASCVLGAVKSNVGHLDTAAGVAGLIKTTLALHHGTIPPTVHFETANPRIGLDDSPFHVNDRPLPWPRVDGPRRAGVSSFGIGGTNAHIVLEGAPVPVDSGPDRGTQILTLSAASPAALKASAKGLGEHLLGPGAGKLGDVAYTLHVGRRELRHRRAVVATDPADAAAQLGTAPIRGLMGSADRDVKVAFMFPGQGAQRVGMASDLYRTDEAFRRHLDECLSILRTSADVDLRSILLGADPAGAADLHRTVLTQPALFAIEYSLARMWMSEGVVPAAMIGHSIGEYVAACLAGVLSLESALLLVATRGRLVDALPGGSMLSVSLPEAALRARAGGLAVAAVNAPDLCVLSGAHEAIARMEAELAADGVAVRHLTTSHAFHSPMMEAALDGLRAAVADCDPQPPRIPYVSNVTGTWIRDDQATDPGYWAEHLLSTVRFGDGLRTILDDGGNTLLEVGPGESLGMLARRHPAETRPTVIATLPSRSEPALRGAAVPEALARLWVAGVPVDWVAYHAGERRARVKLPTYPFQRERYWVGGRGPGDAMRRNAATSYPAGPDSLGSGAEGHARPQLSVAPVAPRTEVEALVAKVWQEMLGLDEVGVEDPFVDLGGHSLIATQITSRLREIFETDVGTDRFFALETVAAVAAEIERRLLEEVEQMSDDAVQNLMSDESGVSHGGAEQSALGEDGAAHARARSDPPTAPEGPGDRPGPDCPHDGHRPGTAVVLPGAAVGS